MSGGRGQPEIQRPPQEEIEQMIEDCEKRSGKLSERELEFIDSVSRVDHALSNKQVQWLSDIWDRIT